MCFLHSTCLWKRVSFNIIASSWIMGTSRILIPKQYLESRRHKSPSKMAQFQGFFFSRTSQDHMKSVGDVIYADLFTEVRWVNTVNTERTIFFLSTNQLHGKKIDEGEHVDRIDTLQSLHQNIPSKHDIFLIRAFGVPTWTLGSSLPGGPFQRLRFSVLQIPGRSSTCSWEPMNGNVGEDMMKT